jgi:hypothetical protein
MVTTIAANVSHPPKPRHHSASTWRPLLQYCLQPQKSATTLTQIQQLSQHPDLDWQNMVSYAQSQGVLLLLHEGLKQAQVTTIPRSIDQELQIIRRKIALKNIGQLQELARIIPIFQQHSIPVLTFKGPSLALTAYKNIGLRQFGDLDLLVQPKDFLRSLDLLIQVGGYQPDRQLVYLNPKREAKFLMDDHEASVSRHNANVDLHKSMLPGYFLVSDFKFKQLYAQAESIHLSGDCWAKTLNAEDMLIYLCIHGAKEYWRSLKWVCDIATFIHAHPDLNWPHIFHKADRLCGKRMVLIGGLLAHQLLDISLPTCFWSAVQADPASQTTTQYFITQLFNPQQITGFGLTTMRLYARMMQHWPDRLNLLRYLLRPLREAWWAIPPTTRDRDWLPLPQQYMGLYYLLRPVRLAGKLLGMIRARLSPDQI